MPTTKTILVSLLFVCLLPTAFAQPANDDPCGATELIVEIGADCVPTAPIVWENATATSGVPEPGCASYGTGDIWFKFSLGSPADIFITVGEGSGAAGITDGGMTLYNNNGSCEGAYFRYLCDDDAGEGSMPQIAIPALGQGTYYIRFWDYNDNTSGNIGGICVAANPVASEAPNDDPCTATALEVLEMDNCVPATPVSWVNATATSGMASPSCGSYLTGDIWFTYTLTDTSDIVITTAAGTEPNAITNGSMALYQPDDCNGGFIEIECSGQGAVDPDMPHMMLLSQLPGEYYIRFWDLQDKVTGNFGGICVAALPSVIIPLLNDDPCGAIELTVENDTSCLPAEPFAWSLATDSEISHTGFLCGTYQTGDIWWKFTLPENSDIYITTSPGSNTGAITDGAMVLYKADVCDGNLTFAFCNDDSGPGNMPQIKEKNIPAGEYYIRFWDYNDEVSGNIGGICVAAVPTSATAPNDNCFTGISFPPISTDGNCSSVAVNTEGATGNGEDVCGGFDDDNVWYFFTVPPDVSQIQYEITLNDQPVDHIIRLFSGGCEGGGFLGCFETSSGVFENLISGKTYTLVTYNATQGQGSQYEICLKAAAPLANDEPCGAITIIPDLNTNDCQPATSYEWEFATASMGFPEPTCGSYQTGDVWFKFELTQKSDITIKTFAGSGFGAINDGAMVIYREAGDCNTLLTLGCADDTDLTNYMPQYSDVALDPGFYYIRFWEFNDAISGNIDGICVIANPSISTAPNDQCSGAIAFPPIPLNGDCASVEVNNEGSTGTPHFYLPGYNDDDLWYSFVVPDGFNTLVYDITTIEGNNRHVVSLSSSCGQEDPDAWFEAESMKMEDLIPGETYFLRVYTPDKDVHSVYTFCLRIPPPPPANDECAGAFAFPVIPEDGTCATVHVITEWATVSGAPSCGEDMSDVWFSFVAPAGTSRLLVDFINIYDVEFEQIEVYSGACGNLESIKCVEDYTFESSAITGLIPGETYFIRTHTGNRNFFEFDICLRVPDSPPSHDECENAIPFPEIPADGNCATVIVDVTGATGDLSEACEMQIDDDVWYTFSIPDGFSGIIVKSTSIDLFGSAEVTIYSGTCDMLTYIGCSDQHESMILGLTPGETYYARAQSFWVNKEGSFDLCIRVAPPPPANDSCQHAIAFPEIPDNGDWVSVTGTTLSATGDYEFGCSSSPNDDVWYTFIVPDGFTDIVFMVGQEDRSVDIELVEGPCDDLTSIICDYNSDGVFRDLTPGNEYFIRVSNSFEFRYSEFELSLKVALPVVNDDCLTAMAFPDLPIDGSCVLLPGNNFLATPSGFPSCSPSPAPVDVWYSFIVPEPYTSVTLDVYYIAGASPAVQLMEGPCEFMYPIECLSLPNRDDFSSLTPGQKYHLMVSPFNYGEFELCLSVTPLPPDNDHCATATSITSNPGVFADPGRQTTTGATDSEYDMCWPHTQTQMYTYDVWYSFTTDQDGGDATVTVSFTETESGFFDFGYLYLEVFEGTCGDLNSLSCANSITPFFGTTDTVIELRYHELDPLTTYYFRVYPRTFSRNYAPVDFSLFAEGTALDPVTSTDDEIDFTKNHGPEIENVYPSPAHSEVNIDFIVDQAGTAKLYLTDMLGQVVYHRTQSSEEGRNKFSVRTDWLPQGVYMISIEKNGVKSKMKKVVIQQY